MHGRGWQILGGLSLLLVLISLAAAYFLYQRLQPASPGQHAEQLLASVTPPASLAELATQFPQLGNVLTDPKLDSVYKDFLRAYEAGGLEAAYELAQKRGLLNANGDLRLTLELDTTETAPIKQQLSQYGVIISAEHGNEIDIVVPRSLLEQLVLADDPAALFSQMSGLEHIVRIRLPIPTIIDQGGGVDTESVPVIGADVWHQAGITGKGVKVGVLDRGFDSYKRLLGTDLPAEVAARSFISGVAADDTGIVHGTAVAEIIYDIAPDAQLYLAAYDTDAEERQAVDWLVAQGVRVISHSAGSIYGPMDGTSPDAVMVDQLVGDGIVWVNSAGNTGYTHYRGSFTDKDGDGFHEFSPGDEMMDFIPDGRTVFVLNWDDWGRGLEDFDLYILDKNGNEIASSTNVQDGPEDDSAEGLVYTFDDSEIYYLAFKAVRNTRPVVFDFFMRDGQIEYYTPEHSVTTPGDARRAITVGATYWSTDQLEDYSSRGPTNDGRMKPDIVAPAGVSSAAYGEPWDGTSASTPHVSAAAALVLQVHPEFTPQQVADFLESRAMDLTPDGPDDDSGYGRLNLGDPPPLPESGQPTQPPPPTATATAVVQSAPATQTAAVPTATPERVNLATPAAGSSPRSSAALLMVGLVMCVALPAILGLGGLGLFAVLWAARRNRPAAPSPYPAYPPARPYPPAGAPPAGPPTPAYRPADFNARPAPARPIPPAAPPVPAPNPPPAAPPAAESESQACPRCGTMYRPGARFCSSCGLALSSETPPEEQVFCTKCGSRMRASSKFCPNCGHKRE
jgi:subtilisin family serine protease